MNFTPVYSFIVQMCLPVVAAVCFWSRYVLHYALYLRLKENALPKWVSYVLTPKRDQQELEAFYDRMVKESTSTYIVVYNVCSVHVYVCARAVVKQRCAGAVHQAISDIQMHRRAGWYLIYGVHSQYKLLGRCAYWDGRCKRCAHGGIRRWSAVHQLLADAESTKRAQTAQHTIPSPLLFPLYTLHRRLLQLESCLASSAIRILHTSRLWRGASNCPSLLRMPRVCSLNDGPILLPTIPSGPIQPFRQCVHICHPYVRVFACACVHNKHLTQKIRGGRYLLSALLFMNAMLQPWLTDLLQVFLLANTAAVLGMAGCIFVIELNEHVPVDLQHADCFKLSSKMSTCAPSHFGLSFGRHRAQK